MGCEERFFFGGGGKRPRLVPAKRRRIKSLMNTRLPAWMTSRRCAFNSTWGAVSPANNGLVSAAKLPCENCNNIHNEWKESCHTNDALCNYNVRTIYMADGGVSDTMIKRPLLGELLFAVCLDHVLLNIGHDRCVSLRRRSQSSSSTRWQAGKLTLYSMENSPGRQNVSWYFDCILFAATHPCPESFLAADSNSRTCRSRRPRLSA